MATNTTTTWSKGVIGGTGTIVVAKNSPGVFPTEAERIQAKNLLNGGGTPGNLQGARVGDVVGNVRVVGITGAGGIIVQPANAPYTPEGVGDVVTGGAALAAASSVVSNELAKKSNLITNQPINDTKSSNLKSSGSLREYANQQNVDYNAKQFADSGLAQIVGVLGSEIKSKPKNLPEAVYRTGSATLGTLLDIPAYAIGSALPDVGYGKVPFESQYKTGVGIGEAINQRGLVGASLLGAESLRRSFSNDPYSFAGTAIGYVAFPELYGRIAGGVKFIGAKELPTELYVEPKILSGQQRFPEFYGSPADLLKRFKNSKYKYDPEIESMFHEAPTNLKGGAVGKGSSESPGLYGAPSQSRYFLKVNNEVGELPSLTILKSRPSPTSNDIQVTSFNRIPSKIRRQGLVSMNRYLESQVGTGRAFISPAFELGLKPEAEAIVPPGNVLLKRDLGSFFSNLRGFKEYQKIEGQKVPIKLLKTKSTGGKKISSKSIIGGNDFRNPLNEYSDYVSGKKYVPIGQYSVFGGSYPSRVSSSGRLNSYSSRVLGSSFGRSGSSNRSPSKSSSVGSPSKSSSITSRGSSATPSYYITPSYGYSPSAREFGSLISSVSSGGIIRPPYSIPRSRFRRVVGGKPQRERVPRQKQLFYNELLFSRDVFKRLI